MATELEIRLGDELKACMRAGDKVGLAAVRMVRTRIMERRTAKNAAEIKEEDVVDIIRAYGKVLQGSIDELKSGGASDSEDNIVQMRAEIAYLQRFLPKMMDEAQTAALVAKVLAEQGISDPKQAGKATGTIMKEYKGLVDAGLVSRLIKAQLGG